MGSSYHHYAMIGVKASKYIKLRTHKYSRPVLLNGNPAYDKTGKQILQEKTFQYIELLPTGKKFSSTFHVNPTDPNVKAILAEITIVEFIGDFLKEQGLVWNSYDFNRVYDNDVFGIVIHEESNDGVDEAALPDLFKKAKKLLKAVEITETPKLYSIMHHSY